MAYTKPQQRKKKECLRLRGERDKTKNCFGLEFVEKTESGFWSTTLDMGAVL